MKVVINKCFGGFGLSDEAMHRYAKIKGLTLYPEKDRFSMVTYWLVPPAEREPEVSHTQFLEMPIEECKRYNKRCEEQSLYGGDIPRDDPALVQVVEELGERANGRCAQLAVAEIPDDVKWEIDEYDGNERIAESHRTWG